MYVHKSILFRRGKNSAPDLHNIPMRVNVEVEYEQAC